MKGIRVMIHKERNGFVAYIDGDRLDVYKSQREAEKAASLAEAKYNLDIGNKDASLAACHLKYTEMSKLYEDQLKFLERQAVRPQWETPVYFTVGVLTGVAMFYGSSLVVKNLQ